MKMIHQPSVYLVGKQTIDQAEIDRFLADHDVENWSTDTEIAGEKLCAGVTAGGPAPRGTGAPTKALVSRPTHHQE